MLDLQTARLVAAYPTVFTHEEANAVVARAYGYAHLDSATDLLSEPIPGLQLVKSYKEILKLDPTHQMIQFVRMALNISLPGAADVRKGIPEREIVRTMLNFSNFDALVNYARSDPVDPNTTSRAMLEKFQGRYGYYAPIQYLLGRYICEHTLLIQPDADKAQRFIDQEVALNPLERTRVVIVRSETHGDLWLRVHVGRVGSIVSSLHEPYEKSLPLALGDANVLVAMLPPQTYWLSELVQRHVEILSVNTDDGRALILDRLQLHQSPEDFDKAFALATEHNIHLTVVVSEPNAELWKRVGIRLIFGFPAYIEESHLEMDTLLGFASPYVGFKRGKMQYLYFSDASGPRFGAMDLIPDDAQALTVMERLKTALRR